jgi:hypothetical protein
MLFVLASYYVMVMDGLIGSGGLLKCPALTQRRPLVNQAADLDPLTQSANPQLLSWIGSIIGSSVCGLIAISLI